MSKEKDLFYIITLSAENKDGETIVGTYSGIIEDWGLTSIQIYDYIFDKSEKDMMKKKPKEGVACLFYSIEVNKRQQDIKNG